MTAEVVLMNKQAVALAADSAATVRVRAGEKISNYSNKLFTLSKWQPVGVMVYGSAEIMGYPWETVIKMYRKHLGKKNFNKLSGYVDDFLGYLRKFKFEEQSEELYIEAVIEEIGNCIHNAIPKQSSKTGNANKSPLVESFEKAISEINKILNHNLSITPEHELIKCNLSDSKKQSILAKYKNSISLISESLKKNKIVSKKIHNDIYSIIKSATFNYPILGKSGLVFSGFGVSEVFPTTESFIISSIIKSEIMMSRRSLGSVNTKTSAFIIPFAQRDMVNTFVSGIDPSLSNELGSQVFNMLKEVTAVLLDSLQGDKTLLEKALENASDKSYNSFLDRMSKYISEKYEYPITDGVSNLSPGELASMAETLISLTSFKRKISANDIETVGGPVDVAVITKGDGFVWIKRKLYFDAEINRYFFSNYFNEDEENKKQRSPNTRRKALNKEKI